MKKKVYKVLSITFAVITVIFIVYLATMKLINIDMTEGRFSLTYWKQEILCILSSWITYHFMKKSFE